MLRVLKGAEKRRACHEGNSNKLCFEDMLLIHQKETHIKKHFIQKPIMI